MRGAGLACSGQGALYFKPDLIGQQVRPVRALFKFLVPILLLAASLAGAGYLRSTRPAVQPAPAVERVWTVRAEPARFADHRPVLQLFGDLIAGREVTLRPLVAGEVIEASPALVEGGRVAKGDLVVAIDPFHYRIALRELAAERREAAARRTQLQSTLKTEWTMLRLDESQLELARRDLARREQLLGSAAASQKALDDAQMAVAQHEAALAQRRQAIETLEAQLVQQDAVIERLGAAVERAERDLTHTELRAPFAGLVTEVAAAVGKRLGVGDPIARLIDEERIEIRFTLSDAEFGRLWRDGLIGRDLAARWRLGATAFPLEGRVARVEATIDPSSGGVEVYAAITANPDGAPLRPGAFVEVLLPDRLHEQVVELPASALFQGDTVYAIADGRLQPRPVELVADLGGRILVRGPLDAGEPIVTSRLAEIGPGLKVEVSE
jgi:RND family efflux transporter MFP subunit